MSHVENRSQVRERLMVQRERRGLEVFPHQEDADDIETPCRDLSELALHLACVEALPPKHGLLSWPVVNAEEEWYRMLCSVCCLHGGGSPDVIDTSGQGRSA